MTPAPSVGRVEATRITHRRDGHRRSLGIRVVGKQSRRRDGEVYVFAATLVMTVSLLAAGASFIGVTLTVAVAIALLSRPSLTVT